MNLNSLIIVLIAVFTILIVGWMTARRLPTKLKQAQHFQKFAAVAAIFFLCYFVLSSAAGVRSVSYVSRSEYENPSNLSSSEDITKQFREQHRRLELLEMEVNDLRADVYHTYQHYSRFLILLLTVITTVLVNRAFVFNGKNIEEDQE